MMRRHVLFAILAAFAVLQADAEEKGLHAQRLATWKMTPAQMFESLHKAYAQFSAKC